MALTPYTSINLTQNELQNARIHYLASDPSTPVVGQLYFNSSSNKLRTWNGSTWDEYGTSTASGTVTGVSVVTANGFAGTVATSTTTPAITLTTTVTGILKGNGTAISAATAGTDYENALTFSTGLTRSVNTITVNTSQNISTLSNLTTNGFVTTSGGTGALSITTLGTGITTFLSTPSSANLASAVTDETGSGALVFATSPTLVTPALGTPSAVVLTNATGTAASLTAGKATNVVGGSGGTILYQSAVDTTAMLANGTSGQILQANGGTSAPSWVTYAGTSSITTLGTVTTGTWNAGVIAGQYGGTGVANTGKRITLGGDLTTFGPNNVTFTTTGSTNVTLPTSGTLATTTDITNAIQGVKWKDSVRVATTTNGTLATAFANGQVVDGVTLVTGDRILLKDQSTAADNGIYTVNVSGAPTRATDADVNTEVYQMVTYAQEGTVNADRSFVCTTNLPITLGTTGLVFADFASASIPDATTSIKGKVQLADATAAEARTSGTLAVTPLSIANFPVKKVFTSAVSSSGVSVTTCTHNYGTRDVHCTVYRTASPYDTVLGEVERTTTNTITVKLYGTFAAGDFTIVTLG